MKRVMRRIVWTLLVSLAVSAAGVGQGSPQQGQGQQSPKGQPPAPPAQAATPAPPATPPVNKEEEDAYKAFFELKNSDPNGVIHSGEEFLKKFPESRYRLSVYSRLVQAYWETQEIDKLNVAGQKALELNPDNVGVLPVMAYVLPRRFNPNDLDAEQKLARYEGYSKHGIELLEKMQKPAQVTDEEFARSKNQGLAMCHSGLGLVFYHRKRLAEAAAEFEQATRIDANPDASDLFLLGVVYNDMKRAQDAENAFGRCAAIASSLQDRCKREAEAIKKALETAPKQ